ncbi:MAG: methyltransferase [Gammaproteobacteria bacterium]|nr:methyltransferase [Gammaproteobacteria bacterium]|tara:strand:+ start:979 stop:1653 length:675 start_codon:yes stop_codon:yes gene_type:complete
MSSPLSDHKLVALLDRLHAQSDRQIAEIDEYCIQLEKKDDFDWRVFDDDMHRFFADKMVALDRDKAEFCYQLCRALGASRVVEAGTSFGVSTLYLAAAVRDNRVEDGLVIATEWDPGKAAIARRNFSEAGLSEFVDLREGDLRQTLRGLEGGIDFMLVDIWEVAKPALELVSPYLLTGAVVVCDNTTVDRGEYDDYFEFVENPANRFRTMTLPFQGGLELTVRI